MKKTKDVITMVLFAVILLFFGKARADDAVRVYFELTSSNATVWPIEQGRDYLRGRAVFLDANNELATTIGGQPISGAKLILESVNYGSKVLFSAEPTTNQNLTDNDWELAAESVAIQVDDSWQEFAVSYDNVDIVGPDILLATLNRGDASTYAERAVTVEAPLANCYVGRTGGGISPLPALLEELPAQKNDNGREKRSDDFTTVDVFAAFYNETKDKYYFTDILPEGKEALEIEGKGVTLELENGYAQVEAAQDGVDFPINKSDSVEAMHDAFLDGSKESFNPEDLEDYTHWVGDQSGDVTEKEYVNVTEDSIDFDTKGDDTFKNDSSRYFPKTLSKITIVGIPVNEVTSMGVHQVSGFGGLHQTSELDVEIYPGDVYQNLEDKTKKPSPSFRVPGQEDQTYIYGAIVGYHEDDMPAVFAQGQTVTFYLKKEGGIAVNSSYNELQAIAGYYDENTSPAGTKISTRWDYQAILAFQITATAVTRDGSEPSISNLYIDKIETWDDGKSVELDKSFYSDIDEETEGIDFIAQDTVASVTLTDIISKLVQAKAGTDGEVLLEGRGDEKAFVLRMRNTKDNFKIGYKDTSTALESVTIGNYRDNVAKEDVAVFKESQQRAVFFMFKGNFEDTNFLYAHEYPEDKALCSQVDCIDIYAADPGRYNASVIDSDYDEVNVYLDGEKHNTVALNEGVITVKDLFSNSYGETNVLLEDSKITGKVYLPLDNDTDEASDTEFPGTTVSVDDDIVKVGFTLDEITAVRDKAFLELTTYDGGVSEEIIMNLKVAKQAVLNNLFAPVPGVTDTPVELFLADQDGSLIKPVTLSGCNALDGSGKEIEDDAGNIECVGNVSKGNEIEIDLSADNGTIRNVDESVNLTTVTPKKILLVKPDDGKNSMSITAVTKKYGEKTLVLDFDPDFQPPVVGQIKESNCSITIEIFDDRAVDVSSTKITILNSSGEDITGTLTRTDSDNNTSGTILLTELPEDDYTIKIVAKDESGNERDVDRSFSVTCEAPECRSVSPASMLTGEENVSVTIIAEKIDFEEGVTDVSFECEGTVIEVDSFDVVSSTEITVVVSSTGSPSNGIPSNGTDPTATRLMGDAREVKAVVASSAQDDYVPTTTTTITDTGQGGICTVTVTTDSGSMVCEEVFRVVSESETACLSINPSVIKAGGRYDIEISGHNTSFNDNTTVSFDCNGSDAVTINSVTADSDEQLTVSITPNVSGTTGTCNVTAGDLDCGSLTIEPGTGVCSLIKISRMVVRAGRFFPRFHLITITGDRECSFGRRPNVDFGTSDIKVTTIGALGNRVLALVTVLPGAASDTYDVTVDGIGGVAFTIW